MFEDKINNKKEENTISDIVNNYNYDINKFLVFDNNDINGISIEEEFLNLNNNSNDLNNDSDNSNNNSNDLNNNSDNSNNDSEKENLENSKDNTNETDKTNLFETREEIIKMEFNENNFSSNNKILEFDLFPFIFIEEYKNNDNVIDIHYNNQYSLINKFTRYVFNESDIKQVIEIIKKLIEKNVRYCSVESITFKLLDYGQLPATNYIFSCRIKVDKKYFDRDRKDINYKEYKAYRKLLKRDIKEDNYNVREFSDCFYCINKYFDFYLSNIFGHCEYLPETIDSIIDYDYNFSKYTINPIQYMKNIILFKKFISKQQDGDYFNLMKLGFIFYRSIEIKEDN